MSSQPNFIFIITDQQRADFLRVRVTMTAFPEVLANVGYDELYDLQEDPLEVTNLWEDGAHQTTRNTLLWVLNQRMMDYCSRSPWPTWEA